MSQTPSPVSVHLRDIGHSMVGAWQQAFDGVGSVLISRGDIFSEREGPVGANDPIDIKADAVVSPANSFGFMDGGIDLVYGHVFGPGLQRELQVVIDRDFAGELCVGQATIVPTGHPDLPWCISAPTMRVPTDVAETVNAYLAFRAALLAVVAHNASGQPSISTVLCPGLGTSVGRMPVERCARQMRAAWDRVLGPGQPFPAHLAKAAEDERWLMH